MPCFSLYGTGLFSNRNTINEMENLQIFHLKLVFLAIVIHHRTFIASDGGRFVDNPFSDEFRVVTDFQVFQAIAAVKDPFADMLYGGWQSNGGQIVTLQKSAVPKVFQCFGKLQRGQTAAIKCLISNEFQIWGGRKKFPGSCSGKMPFYRSFPHCPAVKWKKAKCSRQKRLNVRLLTGCHLEELFSEVLHLR